LPDLPKVELEIVRESRVGDGGFLALRRLDLVAVRGVARSAGFAYDVLDRRAIDAAVIAAHHEVDGRVHVWLRSSVRPPLALRGPAPIAMSAVLWELPAGLVEPGERPAEAAARELGEELGFDVPEGALVPLGPPAFPAPGFVGEVHLYFHVRVDPARRREPGGDGSPLEDGATLIAVPLEAALEACRRGQIPDAKTELALRRLAEHLQERAHP